MKTMTALVAALALFPALAADDSWKLPLAEKEKILEQNALEKHNILGLYPSQVELKPDGTVDYSTLTYLNVAHSVCWTANYLAGASYRYAFLKKSGADPEAVERARARADELFEAVYRCQLVTGVRGLQARGYLPGRGESYEERWGERTSDVWYQGAGEYENLRWRGDPSHHNYSDGIHGLAQYYDLAAEGPQKERAREAIDALVGYWVDNDLKIPHIDGRRSTHILGFTDGKMLNTRIMMAIAGARVAYHATGKEKFKAMHDRLVDQYGVRGLQSFRTGKDFDDAEHVFCHLENLFRIETDPELLRAYRIVADALWEHHKDDAQSLFTYIYLGFTPDAPDREKALREALFSLQTYPTCTIFKPTMSSLNTDLKPPYPVYAAAWDNEYLWKGHLLRPDGWLSRIVTGVAVAAEDPLVIYAVDQQGDIYQSRDGAATAAAWYCISETLPSPARAIAAGPRIRMVFAACDDGFYGSLTAGHTWRKLCVPEEAGKPTAVHVAPVAEQYVDYSVPKTIYAVGASGIYRHTFKRDRDFDTEWTPVDAVPQWPTPHAALFRPGDHGVLKSDDGGEIWESKSAGLDIPIARTVFAPANTDWVFAGTPAGLFVSKDGGESWETAHLVLQFRRNERYCLGGAAFIDAYWRARYYGFIDDATANTPCT